MSLSAHVVVDVKVEKGKRGKKQGTRKSHGANEGVRVRSGSRDRNIDDGTAEPQLFSGPRLLFFLYSFLFTVGHPA